MRRWNGWGDESADFPLKREGRNFVQDRLGKARALPDASLKDVIAKVPASRLPEQRLISTGAEDRVRHARGQSFGDWLAMRSGEFGVFPDGVAHPENADEVRQLVEFCAREKIVAIPYGGGTSVVGHLTPPAGERPVLSIDLSQMNRLLSLDRESQIATFGPGTPGPLVEEHLRAEGFTLGHFPQSFELSTVGGWVVTRSSGQQSLRYGRIEQLFAGGRVESPAGTLEIPTFPASAAGPDLREMILGSEGRLGILSEVKVRVTPLPEHESFHVAFLPDWQSARELARRVAQAKIQLSMLRLSNPTETATHLTLAGHPRLVGWLERYLSARGLEGQKCMLTYGLTGSKAQCRAAHRQIKQMIKRAGGVDAGKPLGRKWQQTRFRSPYLRNGLWLEGYAVDTLETSTNWRNVDALVASVEGALRDELSAEGEAVHVFTHLSHVYAQGSSIYTTYLFRCAPTYEQTRERWVRLKAAASRAIVDGGGSISHHHGVGTDHAPYLTAEKGALGMAAIGALAKTFDPAGVMNPGKLLPEDGGDTAPGKPRGDET
ncbi:MAG: FAD-binding oxidoreductase [Actinobacteria bacterium]|nr:FAD-binding oxidoreductase [Actinomycetota bacterium]